MKVKLTVNRKAVMDEIARTTSYTGSKMGAEDYERIFTTDEDLKALDRFWNESTSDVCEVLKKYLAGEAEAEDGTYELTLELSVAFDDTLREPMERELFSYFVMSITGKWYAWANKVESDKYAAAAATQLEGIHRKACYKRRPTRPTYK